MNAEKKIKLIECPRDAMQGWSHFIPTEKKIEYLNSLLTAGFDTLDFGSFVSPKAIPQLADTREVIRGLELKSDTRLLAIIANLRGAAEALPYEEINCLGFPFSISETFQLRNTNSTIAASFDTVEDIQNLCMKHKKELVIYISMGFGNPYGDVYDESIVYEWANKIASIGVRVISLADTVGLATKEQVYKITKYMTDSLPGIETGVHLHSAPHNREEKLDAALKGIGGCPMAGDDLVGNMDTEIMTAHFIKSGFSTGLDLYQLAKCIGLASEIFI